jgi:AcrR family transcriptional regulator
MLVMSARPGRGLAPLELSQPVLPGQAADDPRLGLGSPGIGYPLAGEIPNRRLHTGQYPDESPVCQGGFSVTIEPLTPERRRAMTRQHLLEAAAIVFARKGFHEATLDEVAATAGFSKGAVYSNFKSKDDLFVELLDDRIDREFAVVSEVLESGSHEKTEQFPRIRDIVRSDMFWSEDFVALWMEFVLYARRNPEAQAKLAASIERSREQVRRLIEHEYAAVGGTSKYPTRDLAEISLALFNGLGIVRLANPGAVTDEMLDTTLTFLWDAMGVNGEDS